MINRVEKQVSSINKFVIITCSVMLAVLITLANWPVNTFSATNKTVSEINNSAPAKEAQPSEEKAAVEPQPQKDLRIVVNLPAFELRLIENEKVVKTYPIAIASPRFKMPMEDREASQLIWNPSWTPPPSDWARNERPFGPGQPGNPLGVLKIRLGGNYLIHGGGDKSVGQAASHGCIRMRNADVLDLARLIVAARELPVTEEQMDKFEKSNRRQYVVKIDPVIPVEINYETIIAANGRIELYPDVYRRGTNNLENLKVALLTSGLRLEELSEDEQLALGRALVDSRKRHQSIEIGKSDDEQMASIRIIQ